MSFVSRSVPREAEDPPPDPPTELEELSAERARLAALVRRGIRSANQERILRRIAEITRRMLSIGGSR